MTWDEAKVRTNLRDDFLDAVVAAEDRRTNSAPRDRARSIMGGWAASGQTFEDYASRVLRMPARDVATLLEGVR